MKTVNKANEQQTKKKKNQNHFFCSLLGEKKKTSLTCTSSHATTKGDYQASHSFTGTKMINEFHVDHSQA